MRWKGVASGRAEHPRAVAHWRRGVWTASFQVGVVALKGRSIQHVVQPVSNMENRKEHHDRRAQARWRLTTPTARMARIGMGQRRHAVGGCMLSTCDPSQKWPWAMLGSEEETRGKLMQKSERASAEAVIHRGVDRGRTDSCVCMRLRKRETKDP
jgi:hypothetical protein